MPSPSSINKPGWPRDDSVNFLVIIILRTRTNSVGMQRCPSKIANSCQYLLLSTPHSSSDAYIRRMPQEKHSLLCSPLWTPPKFPMGRPVIYSALPPFPLTCWLLVLFTPSAYWRVLYAWLRLHPSHGDPVDWFAIILVNCYLHNDYEIAFQISTRHLYSTNYPPVPSRHHDDDLVFHEVETRTFVTELLVSLHTTDGQGLMCMRHKLIKSSSIGGEVRASSAPPYPHVSPVNNRYRN